MQRTVVDLEQVWRDVIRARDELDALCHGQVFRMSIPADAGDSDVIVNRALCHVADLVAEVDFLRRQQRCQG